MSELTGIPGYLLLTGADVNTFLSMTPAQKLIDTPLTDLQIILRAPELPASGVTNIATARWKGSTGENSQSFAAGVGSTHHPVLYVSVNGTSNTLLTPSAVIPDVPVCVKYTYKASTGDFKAYSSADDGATWTQIGTTQNLSGGGAPFAAARIVPFDVGTRDQSSALMWDGPLTSVTIYDGIDGDIVATADFSTIWSGTSWRDGQGNLWQLRGDSWSWRINESAVQGLPAALAGIPAASFTAVDTLVATPTPLANTSTETLLWQPASVVPASDLAVGSCVEIEVNGDLDGIATSGVFNGYLRLTAGTLLKNFALSASLTGAHTNLPWRLTCKVFVEATGASGSLRVSGEYKSSSASGAVVVNPFTASGIAADLSGGLGFLIRAAMVTANSGNITRIYDGIRRRVA